MTKFIELTVRDTKLTININNIIQFYNLEPNDTGTKMVIFDGVKNREVYVQEKYQDVSKALDVEKVLNDDDRRLNVYEFYSNLPYSD